MSDSKIRQRPQIKKSLLRREAESAGESPFMEAIVAACALVSSADGEIATAERRRFLTLARSEPRLATFSFEELVEEFASHAATFRMDTELGHELAAEKLEPFRDRTREAYIILETCRQIVPADGQCHPAELRMLDRIRELLGLGPDEGGFPASRVALPAAAPVHAPAA